MEDSMLFKLDLNSPLVANTKVFHRADTWDLSSSCDSRAFSEESLTVTAARNHLSETDSIGLVDY